MNRSMFDPAGVDVRVATEIQLKRGIPVHPPASVRRCTGPVGSDGEIDAVLPLA